MNKAAYARKDTFWNKQRVEKGLTAKDVGELTGISEKTISAYFTGFLMPDEQAIRTICDLFEIDFTTGSLEFQHAHRQYKAEHNAPLKYSAKRKRKGQIDTVEDVLERLYGELSCKEFVDIYKVIVDGTVSDIDPMRIIYNKVDYDTYNRINDIMGKD